MTLAVQRQIQAAFAIMRQAVDATGWGGWVKDADLMTEATKVANAVVAATPPANPAPAPTKPKPGNST